MSLSLAAEPRRKGLFEPYFWTRSIHAHTSYTSLIPLLFPDPLPTLTLVDRSKLVRGRLESDTSEMQYLRSVDAQLRQEAGRNLHNLDANQDYIKRLILGTGGTVISLYNGNLRLVVHSATFESEATSRPSSNTFSRPPSSIEHGSEKNLSRNTSIRVKPSTSQGLDRKTSVARRSSLPSVSLLSRQNFVTSEPSLDPPLRVVVQAGTLNNLVDVLVHGLEGISVSVADDNGEMSLREGMKREVVIDRVEFARVWWNVFRSFVTPFVFFEVKRLFYFILLVGVNRYFLLIVLSLTFFSCCARFILLHNPPGHHRRQLINISLSHVPGMKSWLRYKSGLRSVAVLKTSLMMFSSLTPYNLF